jgi:hypothetical protein
MSRQIMKELGLLHRDFPHHLKPNKADQEAHSSGIVQMLTVEEEPPNTEPKNVWFGPKQGQARANAMQRCSKMSMASIRRHQCQRRQSSSTSQNMFRSLTCQTKKKRKNLLKTVLMKWNRSMDQSPKATKPRPEAAPVCGQHYSKRPTGPHLRVDLPDNTIPT